MNTFILHKIDILWWMGNAAKLGILAGEIHLVWWALPLSFKILWHREYEISMPYSVDGECGTTLANTAENYYWPWQWHQSPNFKTAQPQIARFGSVIISERRQTRFKRMTFISCRMLNFRMRWHIKMDGKYLPSLITKFQNRPNPL